MTTKLDEAHLSDAEIRRCEETCQAILDTCVRPVQEGTPHQGESGQLIHLMFGVEYVGVDWHEMAGDTDF